MELARSECQAVECLACQRLTQDCSYAFYFRDIRHIDCARTRAHVLFEASHHVAAAGSHGRVVPAK